MNLPRPAARVLDGLNLLALGLAGTVAAALALTGAADIAGFNLWGRAVPGALDLAEAGLVALVFLAIPCAQRAGGHIVIDLLADRLPSPVERATTLLAPLVTLAVLLLLLQGAWSALGRSLTIGEMASGTLRFPIWPVRALAVAGLTLGALNAVAELVTGTPGGRA